MACRRYFLLAVSLAASGCAEIEFGVPAGGSNTAGADSGGNPAVGGGSPSGEQCLNGADDDADGLVDCADDDCAAFACIEVPPGWLGPVELRADDSPCEGAFSEGIASLKTAIDAPDAVCACACAGSLETCETASVDLFGDGLCGNISGGLALSSGGCSLIDAAGVDSYAVTPEVVAGSCASIVDETLPPVTFEARRLCGPSSEPAGCDAGTCAPTATCVYMPGNVVCPSGFATSFMGNAGVVDSRGCGAGTCSCGAPSGDCTFVLEIFNNSNCQGGTISATSSATCESVNFGGGADKSVLYTATPGLVSCPATGTAAATGGVSVSEPITVCCAQ